MFLAVDKPSGISSFGVIRVLKKFYPGQKIGHSGTLDPMATGLMILAVGKDTKRLTELIGLDKSYIATIDFSKMSDTWDMEYWNEILDYKCEIINGKNGIEKDGKFVESPKLEDIKIKLQSLIPKFILPLPAFSAKKVKGKKLYDMARDGNIVKMDKEMKIDYYEILEYSFPMLKINIGVGSGTYIRSIAYWLGQEFGLGGILSALRRTSIGERKLDDMKTNAVENSHIKFCEFKL